MSDLTVLEICAGAGGQSLGLEAAGFTHEAAVDVDSHACETLRINRPDWKVIEGDVREVSGFDFRGISLLAGGVPCPPFSIAGKQLGRDDDRDLFPEALRLVREAQPRAVLLENVRGFAGRRFDEYRGQLLNELDELGYDADWRVLNASDFGVSQLRPRFLMVALRRPVTQSFRWPDPCGSPLTVGALLADLMGANGWGGASTWVERAAGIAPTVVGGSRKHGGPDLGPTRAKQAWRELGVDGLGIANAAPDADAPSSHNPRLTLRMVARVQAFPDQWQFFGGKTASYRQIGNAFPPLVAQALGLALAEALTGPRRRARTA